MPIAVGKFRRQVHDNHDFIQSQRLNHGGIRLHAPILKVKLNVVLPAFAHVLHKILAQALQNLQLQIGKRVLRVQLVVHLALAAHHPVDHAQQQRLADV